MIELNTVTLEGRGIRLEPLEEHHHDDLVKASADGKLWELWYTVTHDASGMKKYMLDAFKGKADGTMLPWAVRHLATDTIVGSTRYHDVQANIDRVEIGYTWYAQSWWRSNVNTTCKLLLLEHAFETVGCGVVGLRTDNYNFRSQKAIEGIGAKKDGVIRNFRLRRDGSVGDSVMYSILKTEWPDVKKHLELRLLRHENKA